jgi:hypothetical protein
LQTADGSARHPLHQFGGCRLLRWQWRVQPRQVHTNTVESFYSVFKRGMKGVYQHCLADHLHRYVAEFDFRYNNRVRLGIDDQDRTRAVLRGIVGKQLTYRVSSTAL